jgi:hypothetical protein
MVNDEIQDTYTDIVLRAQCIEAKCSILWQDHQIYIDLYNCVSDCESLARYWRPTRLFNQATNRWLKVVDTIFLDKYQYNWEVSNGTPWYAVIESYRYLGFFPHYAQGAGQSFDMFYKVGLDVLTSDLQGIQIPPAYNTLLMNGATGSLLESIGELKKAQVYFEAYEKDLLELIVHTSSRMLPDRYEQLNDLDFPSQSLP